MVRNREPFYIASIVVIAFSAISLLSSDVAAQAIPSGYIPRMARSTSSVVASKKVSSTRNVSQQMGSDVDPGMVPSELGPPPPPTSNAAAPAQIIDSPSYGEPIAAPSPVMDSYPTTQSAPYIESTPYETSSEYGQPIYDSGDVITQVEPGYGCTGCGSLGCDGSGCGVGPDCGAAGYGCDSCVGGCNGGCGNGCYHWIDTLSLQAGVHGFKNGINRGESGSFGFQEAVNWGSPWVFTPLGMNTQIGFRGTQTDFHGAAFTTEQRGQYFVTAGFYKRNNQGLQGGIVFDYLHDDWYTTIDLTQIRGELSLGAPTGNSLGFAFSQSIADDDTSSVLDGATVVESWETQDYYTVFWELQSNQHRFGKLRILGGATGEADAIFGTQMKIPLVDNFSLESEFTYVVPNEGAAQGGTQNEAWNVAFNLVWYPARSMGRVNYAMSPMFDVAGNGSMISRRK